MSNLHSNTSDATPEKNASRLPDQKVGAHRF